MGNNTPEELKLKHVLRLRFSDNDVDFFNKMIENNPQYNNVSEYTRDVVYGEISDLHHGVIRYVPPTREFQGRIYEHARKVGYTPNQLIQNVVNYHFSILDTPVDLDNLIKILKDQKMYIESQPEDQS